MAHGWFSIVRDQGRIYTALLHELNVTFIEYVLMVNLCEAHWKNRPKDTTKNACVDGG